MNAEDTKPREAVTGEANGHATSEATVSRTARLWGPAAVLTVVAAGLVPLLFTAGYYWRGDTQIAYFGAYYHLGEALRHGQYPLMEPFAWRGGNHIVEGNFGLLSPLIMIVGLGATLISNAIVYMTVVKLFFLGVSAAGAYLLSRSYGVARPMAYVVAILVPTSGFTFYADTPSWFPGLVVSGLLPLVWWALRGSLLQGRNPFAALVFGSLLATIGYVFGTGMLAAVIGACIIDALVAKRRAAALRGLLIGLLIGVPAVVVRLPFVLSSSVTSKNSLGVGNNGSGLTHLADLATSMIPTHGVQTPLIYVAWLLPFLVFVDWRKARSNSRDLVGLILVWLVALTWAMGPSTIGPLRSPVREMPYVTLCSVLLGAILFTRARYPHLSRNRLLLAVFITGFCGYLGASRLPQYWRVQLVVAIIVAVGLTVLWLLLRGATGRVSRRAVGLAAAFAGIFTVGLVGVQHHYSPESYAPDRGMPGDIQKYKNQLPAAVGDTFMVGQVDVHVEPGDKRAPLVLVANSWYVSGLSVQNVHANTGYRAYSARYCMNTWGLTCEEALPTLMSTEPKTGLTRADLLSVSSIVLLKSDVPDLVSKEPPAGWHIADNSQMSVVWVRDHPVPTAGGVAWQTPGLGVVEQSRNAQSVSLKVGDVPSGGGKIVLSRIAWPGYQVSNATVVNPVDDYLLTLRVSPADANKEITINYEPPHWTFLLRCLAAAVVAGLAWSVVSALAQRKRRRRAVAPG